MFNNRDSIATVDASKNILDEIKDVSDNILKNLRPVDNRTEQELADNQNIPLDNRTQQKLEDDYYNSVESDADEVDTSSAWDQNKATITKPGPIIKLSTDFNRKVKAATKIKNKYLKNTTGQRNKKNNVFFDWLKTAGYIDTKDQDKINYMFLPAKNEPTNNIPGDAAHFLRTEIDSTNFKKENWTTKIKKIEGRKPYFFKGKKDMPADETIQLLNDIATKKCCIQFFLSCLVWVMKANKTYSLWNLY